MSNILAKKKVTKRGKEGFGSVESTTKIIPENDENEVVVGLSNLTLTDQTDSKITDISRNHDNCKRNITKNKISCTIAMNNDNSIDNKKTDGNTKFPKTANCSAKTSPPKEKIRESWQESMTEGEVYQQPQCQIVTRMIQTSYPSANTQVKKDANGVVGSELQSVNRRSPCYWKGELPPRNYSNPVFSTKLFIGGVPRDITECELLKIFSHYGTCRVEWPSKESHHAHSNPGRVKLTGYIYLIFENESSVKNLLRDCSQNYGAAGEWYFALTVPRVAGVNIIRQVQVIPWVVSDASYISNPNIPLDPKKTIFVGALHGMITAQILFFIMKEVYGDVLFVGLDTDRQRYPIGSARVTFSTQAACFRAIESGYLEIHTSKFVKKIQIDPFLEDNKCSQCECIQGPYFCREKSCFRYFCLHCWKVRHALSGPYGDHKPMIRTHRRSVQSTPYVQYHGTDKSVSYGPYSFVPQQSISPIVHGPHFGFPMNISLPIASQAVNVNRPTGMKLTFGQPTPMWFTYPEHTIKPVWLHSTNQGTFINHESGVNMPQILQRMPYIDPYSSEICSGFRM